MTVIMGLQEEEREVTLPNTFQQEFPLLFVPLQFVSSVIDEWNPR